MSKIKKKRERVEFASDNVAAWNTQKENVDGLLETLKNSN